jgi:hypothetical protein
VRLEVLEQGRRLGAVEPAGLGTTTVKVAEAVARKFGSGRIDTRIRAIIVEVLK